MTDRPDLPSAPPCAAARRGILRDALGVGLATGAYALSFGAISDAAGLSLLQTAALSLLMFTGGSQFAAVGVLGAGGTGLAAAGTAILLGLRNALYGLRLTPLLGVTPVRRLVAAHLVIDESAAMAVVRPTVAQARLGFWATGTSIFVFWNLGTLLGAVGAQQLSDPAVLGLDAAVPAAFAALLAPRMAGRAPWVVAVGAGAVALATTPILPAGVPVLLAAFVAVGVGAWAGPAPPDREASD
jgi:predicted branched-subunit amino acid permease